MSYIIPTNELTLTDIKQFRAAAVEAGITRALALGIARSRDELIVRLALPSTDFSVAAATGWALEQYRHPVIAAAGWGSVFDTGAVPAFAPILANNKVAVFWKFADYSAAPVMQAIRFRVGGAGASTKAVFHFQLEIGAKLEPDLYFTEPVVYDPQDTIFIEAYYGAAIAALTEQFAFGAFITERAGAVIS
jgi:hypothetical protein